MLLFSIISESGNTLPLIADPSESSDGAIEVEGGVTESIWEVCNISYLVHSGMVSDCNLWGKIHFIMEILQTVQVGFLEMFPLCS